jgi:hypothetical protein
LQAAHRFAGVDKLGKNGEILNRKILETQEELVNEHGERLTAADIDRLYSVVDAYDGKHGRFQDPLARKASSIVSTGINMAMLPLVTLGSFTEIFNVAAKTDMSTLIQAATTVATRAGIEMARFMVGMQPSAAHKSRATQMSMAGQTLYSATNAMASRLTDPNISNSAQKMNTIFFTATGLTMWNQAMRNIGAEAMRLTLKEDIDTINTFPNTAEAQRAAQRIQEVGLTVEDVQALMPNSGASTQKVNALYSKAVSRFNRSVALEPSFADRPLWMSNQKMWMLSRLQGYPTMFTNTVLPMLTRKMGPEATTTQMADALFTATAITLLGSLQIGVRDAATGKDPGDRDLLEVGWMSMKRNLFPRHVQLGVDILMANKYRRSPVDSAIGPVATMGTKALQLHAQLVNGDINFEEYMIELSQFTPLSFARGWMK